MTERTWPTLYKTGSNSKELQWEISISPVDDSASWDIVTKHGQVGGAIQESRVRIEQGKNIGRSNETTPRQQAESEAESKWKKQLDKSYSEQRGGATKQHKPMTALNYCDRMDKVTFEDAHIQPKLDGHRCLAVCKGGEIILYGRNKEITIPHQHIRDELKKLMLDGEILDGELYSHTVRMELGFSTLTSYLKKTQPGSEKVEYHVYDSVRPGPFGIRYYTTTCELLRRAFPGTLNSVKLVETHKVEGVESLNSFHNRFVEQGYEGSMLRLGGYEYKEGGDSPSLLKVKDFIDEEFTILDVIPDGVARPTHGKFVCQMTNSTATFQAVPEGPHAIKEQYLRDRLTLIGKPLTVRYFELTDTENPVPRFPVAVAVRDYE